MAVQMEFRRNDVFSLSPENQKELFDQLGEKLNNRGDVTDGFAHAVYAREQDFPTALDMQPVFSGGPNIAIPHTEPKYCRSKKVVVVQLTNPIIFQNMINPKQDLPVRFLFVILNNDPAAQTNILANLMDLFKSDHFLGKLGSTKDADDVFQVLKQYVNVECV